MFMESQSGAIALHLGLYGHVGGDTAWFALQSLNERGWHQQRYLH